MYMPLYALFPFSYAVLADFFWVRVLREPRRGLRLRRPKYTISTGAEGVAA